MQFTEKQVKDHEEAIQKLEDVATYLKTSKVSEFSLNNPSLSNLLSQIKYVLTVRMPKIHEISSRRVEEVRLLGNQEEPLKEEEPKPQPKKRGRPKKETKA